MLENGVLQGGVEKSEELERLILESLRGGGEGEGTESDRFGARHEPPGL